MSGARARTGARGWRPWDELATAAAVLVSASATRIVERGGATLGACGPEDLLDAAPWPEHCPADEVLVVGDAPAHGPRQVRVQRVRFLARVPLLDAEGTPRGALELADTARHALSAEQILALRAVARAAVSLLTSEVAEDAQAGELLAS